MKPRLKREIKEMLDYSLSHSGVVTAAKFGMSPSQVSYHRKLAGIKRPNKSEVHAKAYKDHKNGLGGICAIAKKYKISVGAFAQYVKNGGTFKQPNDSRHWHNPNARVSKSLVMWVQS